MSESDRFLADQDLRTPTVGEISSNELRLWLPSFHAEDRDNA
ncbi:MAG TPA: hypothetical protein V6D26_04695 [Stenomitos sp.]